MSFDAYAMRAELSAIQSQSLWNRAMSFDLSFRASCKTCGSQSLWNRAMSFDARMCDNGNIDAVSQSLWNRAMSFDRAVPRTG